jgi:hypothetical protein
VYTRYCIFFSFIKSKVNNECETLFHVSAAANWPFVSLVVTGKIFYYIQPALPSCFGANEKCKPGAIQKGNETSECKRRDKKVWNSPQTFVVSNDEVWGWHPSSILTLEPNKLTFVGRFSTITKPIKKETKAKWT